MALHVHLKEWSQVGGSQDRAHPELMGGSLVGAEARAQADRLARSGILEVMELRDGLRIRSFAHVGRVQIGELTITIEPKVGTGELLQLMRYAYGLGRLTLFDDATYATRGRLLQDLLVAQLVAEISALVGRGLAR